VSNHELQALWFGDEKGDRFVLVGSYPRKLKRMGYHDLFDGPEYFGELYHEACYLESVGEQESKECVKP
jgi:hypothetical protein